MIKLYEVSHPYYLESSNYFQSGFSQTETYFRFDSWDDFFKEAKDWDDDYNYLIRWDWNEEWVDEDKECESIPEHIKLHFFRQRKGFHVTMHINATKDEEAKIKAYLKDKADYLKKLWYPILEDSKEVS